jgi:stearoyl-CoA desaturase (delta-9 desaturase)
MSSAARAVMLLAVVLPLLGLIGAVALLWGHGFSWVHLGLMLGMYLLTVLGITAGFTGCSRTGRSRRTPPGDVLNCL